MSNDPDYEHTQRERWARKRAARAQAPAAGGLTISQPRTDARMVWTTAGTSRVLVTITSGGDVTLADDLTLAEARHALAEFAKAWHRRAPS